MSCCQGCATRDAELSKYRGMEVELAGLKADCRALEMAKAEADALAMSYEGMAERLKAELAAYKDPLTDEQYRDLYEDFCAAEVARIPAAYIDAAILRVRAQSAKRPTFSQ